MMFKSRITKFLKVKFVFARLFALVSLLWLPACSIETNKGAFNIMTQFVSSTMSTIKAVELLYSEPPQFHILDISFPSNDTGLIKGAAINVNGTRIGSVKDIFTEQDGTITIARAAIGSNFYISRSVTVNLSFMGLTGMCQIELDNIDESDGNILELASEQGLIARISADDNFENPCLLSTDMQVN